MKVLFVLLFVCAAAAYPGINSNRVEDVPSNQMAEFSRKLDEVLLRLDKYVKPISSLSPEDRLFNQKIALIIVDFERTEEDRRGLISQLIQKEDISEEEATSLKTTMDDGFMITKPFAQKSPLVGKLFFTAGAKMITNDEFIFGSQETRKKILLETMVKIMREVKDTPKLFEEFVYAQSDPEFMAILQKGFGIYALMIFIVVPMLNEVFSTTS